MTLWPDIRISASLMATGAALFGSTMALGQESEAKGSGAETVAAEDEGIVVTAQRRSERLRDVPISITALDSAMLERANANQVTDLAKVTPGLRFDYAAGFFQPTIRGVGTSIVTSGGGPNVGIYVDGFLIANPQSAAFELSKIESIQVLKGPQGTLFGRNTTGGAILVTTADPSTETGMTAKISASRFDEIRSQGYVTFGIGENLAVDLEGIYHSGDGYYTNIADGNDSIGRFHNWTTRAGIKYAPSDDFSILLRYSHGATDDPTSLLQNAYGDKAGRPLVLQSLPASTYATRPGDVAINPALPVVFINNTDTFQGTIKADVGFADLTSYTQYRKDESTNIADLDGSTANIFHLFIGIDNKTFTQELLLSSKEGSPLQWTTGLYYFFNRDTYLNKFAVFSSSYDSRSDTSTSTRSSAAFADVTYEITPKLFLTAGGRYSHDEISDAYFIAQGSTVRVDVPDYKSNRFTPRIVLRYKPTRESSIYASFTKGFKAGILNVGGYSTVPIAPEDMKAYEVGYKYENRGFAFDAAGFYYDYKDLQVSSYQNGQAQIRNAASSRIWGFEGQVRYTPWDGLNLNAGASYVNAKYRKFENAPFIFYCKPGDPVLGCGFLGSGSLTQIEGDASGQRMQRAPKVTANMGVGYDFDLGGGKATLGGNLFYSSKSYFDASAQFFEDGYSTLALRAQWEDPSEHFTVSVFGDNITNERYITGGNFATIAITSGWSAPATYGLTLGMKY